MIFLNPNLLIEIYRLRGFLWWSHPGIKSYRPPKHTDILKNRSLELFSVGNRTVFSRKSGIYSAVNLAKHNFYHKNTSATNSVSSPQYSNRFISMKNELLPCFTTWSAEAAALVWVRSLKIGTISCTRYFFRPDFFFGKWIVSSLIFGVRKKHLEISTHRDLSIARVLEEFGISFGTPIGPYLWQIFSYCKSRCNSLESPLLELL